MAWKTWENNMRSKRAIAIDRSLKAKQVYSDFNDDYKKSQNRSDVEDWDTKGKSNKVIAPTPVPQEIPSKEKENSVQEYIPSKSERDGLISFFYKLNPIEQFKDLQTTRNVVRKKSQVEAWKKNPKAYDIRDIDTQPKGYIENRVEKTREYLNVPIWEYNKANRIKMNMEVKGLNVPARFKLSSATTAFHTSIKKGYIFYRKKEKKKEDFYNTLSHELGHQFDFVKGNYKQANIFEKGTKNIKLGFEKEEDIPGNFERNIKIKKKIENVNSYFGSIPYAKNHERIFSLKKGEGSKSFYSKTPGSYIRYINREDERFAEWFSAFITNKSATKRESKQFYNIFKSGSGKELYQKLKRADYDFLKNKIGGNKVGQFNFF